MKTIGIILLMSLPVILSFRRAEEIKQKEKMRKAFCQMLTRVHFQIENFSTPQGEIFRGIQIPVLEKTDFFQTLLRLLDSSPCGALAAAWREYGSDFDYDSQTKELLDSLAEHFGVCERQFQLRELERAIRLLEENGLKSRGECQNKIKILHITGLTAGLALLILLI